MSYERNEQLICECVLPHLEAFGNFPRTFSQNALSMKKVYVVNYVYLVPKLNE